MAQLGSVLAWGASGRRFKSGRPDQLRVSMKISQSNKHVFILLLVLFFILCWYILTASTLLPIKKVSVVGKYSHLDQNKFIYDVMPAATGGFFSVDMRSIVAAVSMQPWVKQVTVRRVWPSTLVIDVTEHQPIARWNENSLLAKDGTVFDSVDAATFTALPQLMGSDSAQAISMWQQYQKMQTMLSKVSLSLCQISLSDEQSWKIALTNGMDITLGKTEILARLARFISVYPQIRADKLAHASIDLRYTNGFAVGDRFPV